MTYSKYTTQTSGNGGQYSSRNGAKIDRIILHHCASTSLSGVLGMMYSGSREVSANYVIGSSGEVVSVVPEESRAWTSGSASWDGRAITFEIVNETAAPEWRISDKAFDSTARVMADVSLRYGFPLNRDTVITHQELYTRYGASYATACPGPYLQPRVDALIALANKYKAGDTGKPEKKPTRKDTKMIGLYGADGQGRWGKKNEKYWAVYDSSNKCLTYLAGSDATAMSANMGTSFGTFSYAAWEAFFMQSERFIDATVDPPRELNGPKRA